MILLSLASIPSPSSNALELGPFSFRAYGLMIALGVIAAVAVSQRRLVRNGGGTADDITAIAMWAVPAGLIGARLYHVITDSQLYRSPNGTWTDGFLIWKGGLGIPGGIFLGAVVGLMVARKRGVPMPLGLDAAAPAIPLAQAIGRLGNWFNQELFGRPTDLPWAVEITDPTALGSVPAEYAGENLFHPTFAYEALWNLGVVALIVALTRWGRLKPGRLFAVYVIGYGIGRLWVESLRIDPANTIAGLRVNTWMSGILIAGGLAWLLWKGPLRDAEKANPKPKPEEPKATKDSPSDQGDELVDTEIDDEETADEDIGEDIDLDAKEPTKQSGHQPT